MYQEAMDNASGHIQSTLTEMGSIIKHEIKKSMAKEMVQYMSPDRRNQQQSVNTPHSISQVGSKSARPDSRSDRQQAAEGPQQQKLNALFGKEQTTPTSAATNAMNTTRVMGAFTLFGKDQDQMTVAKSAFTTGGTQSHFNKQSGVNQKT